MENGFPHLIWTLRIQGHAIRSLQCASDFPEHDAGHTTGIPRPGSGSISRRYPDLLKKQDRTCQAAHQSTTSPGGPQLSGRCPQKRVPCTGSRFPRVHDKWKERFHQSYYRGKTPGLGNPEETNRSTGFHRVGKFLPTLHSKFLTHRAATNVPHTERRPMAVGSRTTGLVRFSETRFHHTSDFVTFRSIHGDHNRNRREQFCDRSNHIPEMGFHFTSNRIPLTQAVQARTKLRNS